MSDNNSPYHYVRPEVIPLLNDGKLFSAGQKAPTRASFAQTVIELGEANPAIVVLDADVSKSIGTNQFGARFPDRHFNFGIAEQNMFAAAAGMATTGLIPFACTYAVFASLRALDMVRNSIHYPNLNVKIAASHSGITPGPDGVTHQGQEDNGRVGFAYFDHGLGKGRPGGDLLALAEELARFQQRDHFGAHVVIGGIVIAHSCTS